MQNDSLVMQGGAVKATGIVNGKGTLAGYGVVHSVKGANAEKDLSGQYFTAKTYLGAHEGDGADGLFHHSIEIKGLEQFADHLFAPVKTKRDEIGLFTEVVLDMANKYERAVYKLGEAGKLGFSSGSASHMVRCADDGEIKRWPIVEVSLTPTPCEPRARAMALKALEAETGEAAMQNFVAHLKATLDTPEGTFDVPDAVANHHAATENALWSAQNQNAQLEHANFLHRQFTGNAVDAMRALHGLTRN